MKYQKIPAWVNHEPSYPSIPDWVNRRSSDQDTDDDFMEGIVLVLSGILLLILAGVV